VGDAKLLKSIDIVEAGGREGAESFFLLQPENRAITNAAVTNIENSFFIYFRFK
jgi:hypothetical protein